MKGKQTSIVYGINPVLQALKSSQRKCYKIIVAKGKISPRIQSIVDSSRQAGIPVERLPRMELQKKCPGQSHQGVVGYFSHIMTKSLDDLVEGAFRQTAKPTLAALDCIQDPQNMGSLIRSAEAQGIQGIILPKNRSAPLNETVAKCSAGAIEWVSIATVTNLAKALQNLKEKGFWAVGVDQNGEKPCDRFSFEGPTVLVFGSEEKGIRPLLKATCDFTVSIPMSGKIDSLNVSVAGAIIFYEILRQKRG
ncbi:MAG: 23S rRNA (guanosine(2251)-2'-O)-methyltransferase RlmB [Nitrospinota bacterium]|nr:23S rRNA (guanosine(2251)-2'-O)-methyltransferase RlmB [Nitrospinota bacterium]